MTFCKILKETTIGETRISAYEEYEKFSDVPNYRIYVKHKEYGYTQYDTIRTARTTWKRKFQSIVDAYESR